MFGTKNKANIFNKEISTTAISLTVLNFECILYVAAAKPVNSKMMQIANTVKIICLCLKVSLPHLCQQRGS